MFACRLMVSASFACLLSSIALAGDVVTLRCDFPEEAKSTARYSNIIADDKGISLAHYSTNKDTGNLEYQKYYVSNEKEASRESRYRINKAEIAVRIIFTFIDTILILDSSIDLRSMIIIM